MSQIKQPIEPRSRIVLLHDTVLENVGVLPHGSIGTVVSVHDETAAVLFEDPIKILFNLPCDEVEAAPELPVQMRRRPDSIVGDVIRARSVPTADSEHATPAWPDVPDAPGETERSRPPM